MKYCPNCRTLLADHDTFCPHCGNYQISHNTPVSGGHYYDSNPQITSPRTTIINPGGYPGSAQPAPANPYATQPQYPAQNYPQPSAPTPNPYATQPQYPAQNYPQPSAPTPNPYATQPQYPAQNSTQIITPAPNCTQYQAPVSNATRITAPGQTATQCMPQSALSEPRPHTCPFAQQMASQNVSVDKTKSSTYVPPVHPKEFTQNQSTASSSSYYAQSSYAPAKVPAPVSGSDQESLKGWIMGGIILVVVIILAFILYAAFDTSDTAEEKVIIDNTEIVETSPSTSSPDI